MTVDIWALHTGTLSISAVVITASIAAMTFVAASARPVDRHIARSWGWAMVAAAFAFFCWFIGQSLGYWVEFLLGNVAAVLFSVLLLRSAHLLVGRTVHPGWLRAQFVVGSSGIVIAALTSVPRGIAAASIAVSFLWAGLGAIVAIARSRDARSSSWGKALILALAAWCLGVVATRLYVLAFGAGGEAVRPMASTAVQVWAIFSTILMLVVFSLGFLALLADQQRKAVLESMRRDGLTGVLTRTAFLEQAQVCAGGSRQYAVLMLDLDHFKRVNDTYGHLSGDIVLRQAATQLLRAVRDADIVGRFGGEEFCVVLPECDVLEAAQVARRVCQLTSRHPASLQEGQNVPYTVSIGVATSAMGASLGPPALERTIDLADRALYHAKSRGRNQVQVFAAQAALGPQPSALAIGSDPDASA